MHRVFFFLVIFCLICHAATEQEGDIDLVAGQLNVHQFDLASDGGNFLLEESRLASFFMIGELHGDREIPDLLEKLWPEMWRQGYRHIAAELSPWTANQLEFTPADRMPKVRTLWSKREAMFVHSLTDSRTEEVLWGCDMDEMQPNLLIGDLATANPGNVTLAHMAELARSGYKRELAPELLRLMPAPASIQDKTVNGTSLAENIKATLDIENDRLRPETRFAAQQRRELLMKELFVEHYQRTLASSGQAKIMLRFGRNHLHRGYDARGISTLGNFVAEFASAQHKPAFNVAAFGAGGKATLAGESWDADERGDDLAFAFLASLARYPATVFDLRPLRGMLHAVPEEKRTDLQRRLVYWVDSYDAIICYKNVMPFDPMP